MRRAAIAALLAIAGCGDSQPLDVCAGRANCLAVHVAGSGSITSIDQVGVSVSGAIKVDARDPMSPGGGIDLPVAIAILYPQGRNGLVDVKATGFLDGRDIGEGSTSGQVVAGGNSSVSITLTAPSGGDQSVLVDAGVQDLAGRDTSTVIPDMVGTDFSLIDFAGGKDFAIPIDMTVLPDLSHPDLTPPAPILTGVAPPSGPSNGGTMITLSGDNFVNGATVTLGGLPAAQVTFVNAQTLTARTPPDQGPLGKVMVVVRNPDGQSAGGSLFTYFAGNVNFNANQQNLIQMFQTLRAVATADFTGDGQLDLVVTGQSKQQQMLNTVVLPGNGNGNFNVNGQLVGNGSNGHSVAVVDVDHNGEPDVAVAYLQTDNLGVMTDINHNLQAQNTYPVSLNGMPQKVIASDVNGDGWLDLLFADSNATTFGVYYSDQASGFKALTNFAIAGTEPWSLATGDFNGDGKPDVAVCAISSSQVSVSLATNNGNFLQPVAYATGLNPHDVAAGDLNGDGALDLAVALNGATSVAVLLGKGDGTFQAAVNYQVGNTPSDIALADFNLDGTLDVAVSCSGNASVSILVNNGDGTFPMRLNFPAANQAMGIAVGYFNGDGLPDIANVGQQSLAVLLNNSK